MRGLGQSILEEGREKGRKEGREKGRKEGREKGRKEGREEGRKEGREEGRKEGREESIRAFIMDDLEEDIPKEHSIIKLQKYFKMTKEKAEQLYGKYAMDV